MNDQQLLGRHLRDLADDLDLTELDAGLARASWRTGRRRRWTEVAVTTTVVAAVAVALVVSVLPGRDTTFAPPAEQRARTAASGGVTGYPERVERRWHVVDCSAQSLPAAAVLQDADLGWYAVGADGGYCRLSSASGLHPAALSPDGRAVAFMEGAPNGRLAVVDLITHEGTLFEYLATEFHSLEHSIADGPLQWSPDGSRIAVNVVTPTPDGNASVARVLVLGTDGSTTALPFSTPAAGRGADGSKGTWRAAGWRSPDEVVVVRDAPGQRLEVRSAIVGGSAGTAPPTQQRLPSFTWPRDATYAASWFDVSPDGRRLLVQRQTLDGREVHHGVVDLLTGKLEADPRESGAGVQVLAGDPDPLGAPRARVLWAGDEVWTAVGGTEAPVVFGVGVKVALDPRLDVASVTFARDALVGKPTAVPWGTSTSVLVWWRHELLAGLAALVLTVLGLAVLRARRREVRVTGG